MAIDPRISLAVQAPDIMTALTGGLRAGEQIRNAGVRDQLLNQQAQVNQMNIANAQGAHMNKLAQALGSVPAQDRAAVLAQQMPYLEQLGIDPAQMLSGDLTDQGVQELFQATLPFAQMEEASEQNKVGIVSPKDFTAPSIAKFQVTGDYSDLVRYQPVTLRDINGVTYAVSGGKLYTPEYRPDGSVTTGALVDESEVTGGGTQVQDVADVETQQPQQLTPEAQRQTQIEQKAAEAQAVAEAKQDVALADPEKVEQNIKGIEMTMNTINSIDSMLADENLGSVTGQFGKLPTVRTSTEGLLATANQLSALLTMENRDMLTGVLSDRDIGLLATLGSDLGMVLDDMGNVARFKGSYESTVRKMNKLKNHLVSGLNRSGIYVDGQTSSNPTTGEKLIYLNGEWVAQ
jgi:hypothetical protein